MDVFSLVAKLTLSTEEYDKNLDKAVKDAGEKSGIAASKIQAGVDKIQKGAALMSAAGVAAIGAFSVSAVKTGEQFDSSMSQVAATMGYTVDELNTAGSEAANTYETLRNFAQEMGASTAFSASQAADALNYMALAGYDAETSMAMLPNVLNLAAAGGIELAQASDMVTDAQSALGLTLDETAELVDKMARASSKSNTSVAQLGDAILTVGGTAKNLAGGTTELSSALGILADNGIKGAEGGTALRNIILALSAPTDTAAKKMEKLGLETYDAAGNLRPIEDIFLDLNNTLSTMTQGEQTDVLNTLFNKVDLKSANALLATSAERWGELSVSIDNAQGAAQAMAETQLDNLAGDITLLKSAFEGLQIQVADKLAPALRTLVEWLTRAIEHADTIIPVVLGAAAAFGTFSVAINIGNLIKGVTTAMTALNVVLAANPIGIVIAAVAGLTVALVALWNTNDKFRESVTEAWEKLREVATAVFGAINDIVKNVMVAVLSTVGEKLSNIKTAFKENGGGIKGIVAAGWERIKGYYTAGFDILDTLTGGKLNDIKNLFTTEFKNLADSALNWGSDLIQNFIDGITQKWNDLKSTVSNTAQKVKDFLGFSEPKEGPLSNFHTYAPDMMALFAKGIRDNENLITDQINKSFDFGTRTVPFSASGIGAIAQKGESYQSNAVDSTVTLDIVVRLDDGTVLQRMAHKLRPYMENEDFLFGGSLV